MSKESIQKQLSEVSSYSQINIPFRHAYGEAVAAVFAVLLYKHDYWNSKDRLEEVKTPNGNTLHKFHLTLIDLAFESGVSFSMLEKNNASNPIVILEKLGLIKRLKRNSISKADSYVLYNNKILSEIKNLAMKYNEDSQYIRSSSSTYKIKFYKALRGKKSREEIYKTFKNLSDNEELVLDDIESTDTSNPSFEGILDSL